MNDGSAFQKRRQLLEMLDAGLVMLHLDPRPAEVVVPVRFKSDPVLRLNIAYQFRLPALDIGAEGIYAVLSFDRQNCGCTLPWSCVFAMTHPNDGHDGVVWPESVPPELKASFAKAGVVGPTRLRQITPASMTPAAIEPSPAPEPEPLAGAVSPSAAVLGAAEGDAPPAPRRGHLRLVK